jgi:glycosyltransferase involved in cell wall biosynthesis
LVSGNRLNSAARNGIGFILNILILTPLIPYPPHDGDKLRLYHFLQDLKKAGHQMDLFCLTRVKSDFQFAASLRPLCRNLYLEHLTDGDLFFNLLGGPIVGHSFNVSSYFSPKLRESLKAYWKTKEGQGIQVVLAHRLRMAPAAFEGNPGKPVVLDMTDCMTSYMRQIKEQPHSRFSRKLLALWDYWFLRREEAEWSEGAFQTTVISETDAQALRDLGAPADKITVIPNGVEAARGRRFPRPGIYPKEAPVVCFVGNMGYAANEDGALWFLKRVWPQVKQKVPAALFAAVGGAPRKKLLRYHNQRDVFITGWVPDVEPYLTHASLSIAPLRVAAGMQNKVALSLALGVAVVASPQAVAWLPLEGRPGVKVAENEEIFSRAVGESLLNPRILKAGIKKSQSYILKYYRWKETGRKLERVLKTAARASATREEK